MRTLKDVLNTITEDILCGNSTIAFEHGFELPKLGTRAITMVDTTHIYYRNGDKKKLTTLNKQDLLKVEKSLREYIKFVMTSTY